MSLPEPSSEDMIRTLRERRVTWPLSCPACASTAWDLEAHRGLTAHGEHEDYPLSFSELGYWHTIRLMCQRCRYQMDFAW